MTTVIVITLAVAVIAGGILGAVVMWRLFIDRVEFANRREVAAIQQRYANAHHEVTVLNLAYRRAAREILETARSRKAL